MRAGFHVLCYGFLLLPLQLLAQVAEQPAVAAAETTVKEVQQGFGQFTGRRPDRHFFGAGDWSGADAGLCL